MIVHVENAKQFDDLTKQGRVLVDFWAPWCGPCRMLGPVLEQIDAEGKELTVLKVNVDEQGELAARFSVYSIPTMILYNEGKIVGTKVGYIPKGPLEAWALNTK
ncbi:MAG: thioredoxin [Bacilli bacterium]|jgi:thioredoxin 1|nr:thioredoxin [Bacilli bacterium]MCH4201598.1 thioredoxin [Bacilli bacterium]